MAFMRSKTCKRSEFITALFATIAAFDAALALVVTVAFAAGAVLGADIPMSNLLAQLEHLAAAVAFDLENAGGRRH